MARCQTSRSWGFQLTATRPPSVRCERPEHKRTSARPKVHIDCSITCSPSAHRQRRLPELDPSTQWVVQLADANKVSAIGSRTLRDLVVSICRLESDA